MHGDELVALALLIAVTAMLVGAYRTRIPYPILLVVGSAVIALIPGVPKVEVDPNVILVVALPPLLYSAAFFTSLHDLRRNLRPIGLLAIGLVIVTTLAVGAVAHFVIGLSWGVAFVLGAVVSPTDPVAATAIAGRLGAPQRYVAIVEGESLLNDASGLVVYRIAILAVLSGTFSLAGGVVDFVVGAGVGIAIGALVGVVVAELRRRIDDAPTEITISLLTPYFAYLPAEALGVSAVTAAVTAGIWLGWRAPELISPETRIQAYAFWEIVVFVLNSALFVIIGLELRGILDGLGAASPGELLGDALVVIVAVIAVRFAWVYPATYLPRRLSARIRARDPAPTRGSVFLVAFTGMRGAVSLAAALAIPHTLDSGAPFPDRDLVLFLVYAVILGTLLIEGLSLPAIIERFGLGGESDEDRELRARILAAQAAIARLDELAGEDWVRPETVERMRGLYEFRLRRFAARLDLDDDGSLEEGSLAYQRLRREALEAERGELLRLRRADEISEEAMRRVERDLDLEDARLEI
ncbi:MAG TPA: Na+/H+ antiporter [Solirubrobacteraceae bacterium]|nr:Na+/H+ antiporter [Solirubrobacteraceae bacterium]